MNETGGETLYVTTLDRPVANLGVAVQGETADAIIDPWFLGSPNERDVQGYAGTPVNVNDLTPDFSIDLGAAGAAFPKVQRFYIAVDSGSDPFTHRSLPGRYIVRSWINDMKPPKMRFLTKRVAAGRPTLVARVTDAGSGVDPLSLVIAYRGVLVGAVLYDPDSGTAIFPLPSEAPRIPAGHTNAVLRASDFQEAKNVTSAGNEVLPNTAFRRVAITAVRGPAVTWVVPKPNQCVGARAGLLVVASSTRRISSVRFFADGKQIALDRKGATDVFGATWRTRGAGGGEHELRAAARDAAGRTSSSSRHVRVCR
jgi:hypothetical protein